MSQIKGKNTKPEILVRKYLFSKGLRFRIHDKRLPGKPDIVLPKYRSVVLIHGCFWHGHEKCKYSSIPKTRTDWWVEKINQTKSNDISIVSSLKNLGWKVFTVWECELKTQNSKSTLEELSKQIKQNI